MSFWTAGKTTLALACIGILIMPTLRRLLDQPSSNHTASSGGLDDSLIDTTPRTVAPPELSLGGNGSANPAGPRH